MKTDTTRRGVLAGVLAAGVGGLTLTSARELLDQFAPLSGDAWDAANRSLPDTVESPYGEASVRYDEFGVPTVAADGEAAAYFAVGYTQAFDRLFQLDLQRQVMRGQVSELVGESTVEDDEFHIAMDFAGAAEATWEHVSETPAGPLIEAYADGVNAVIEDGQLPLEFELLGAEPEPWTPVDSMLMEKQISWDLTGNFAELRQALLADRLGKETAAELYPERLDHDVPILRDTVEGERLDADERGDSETERETGSEAASDTGTEGDAANAVDRLRQSETASDSDTNTAAEHTAAVGPALLNWLSRFESPPGVGSNSWVVSGEHTESGTPTLPTTRISP